MNQIVAKTKDIESSEVKISKPNVYIQNIQNQNGNNAFINMGIQHHDGRTPGSNNALINTGIQSCDNFCNEIDETTKTLFIEAYKKTRKDNSLLRKLRGVLVDF